MLISCMDAFDLDLLDALQRNGRMTNNELAEQVRLSPSQCSRRRAQLEQDGVIAGYHAELSGAAIGLEVSAFVRMALHTHSPENAKRFLDLINSLDEVQEAYALTGESDYLVKIIVPSLAALSRLLADVFLPNPAVANVRSSIVLDCLKRTRRAPLAHLRAAR